MGKPNTPLVTFIDKQLSHDAKCDPELPARALQFRVANQLMQPKDFYLNITVWKLVRKTGEVEYLARQNESDEANFEKAVQLRVASGMTRTQARKDAGIYSANSGIHSEVGVVAEIYRRSDIRKNETKIEQIFTEREPCYGCKQFMRNNFPVVLAAPFFYYFPTSQTERRHYLKNFDGHVGLFLLNRYNA